MFVVAQIVIRARVFVKQNADAPRKVRHDVERMRTAWEDPFPVERRERVTERAERSGFDHAMLDLDECFHAQTLLIRAISAAMNSANVIGSP